MARIRRGHNKERRTMRRYKKRIAAMGPDQFFKELRQKKDEYLGGRSAKMQVLITHLLATWENYLTTRRVRAIVLNQDSVANMSDGFARQRVATPPAQAFMIWWPKL
jgi:hypothetical protein